MRGRPEGGRRPRWEGARSVGGCAREGRGDPRGTREAGEGPGSERSATSVTGHEPIPSSADPEGAALCREEAAGKRRPFLLRSWNSSPKTC